MNIFKRVMTRLEGRWTPNPVQAGSNPVTLAKSDEEKLDEVEVALDGSYLYSSHSMTAMDWEQGLMFRHCSSSYIHISLPTHLEKKQQNIITCPSCNRKLVIKYLSSREIDIYQVGK